jgi:hypothetical protein
MHTYQTGSIDAAVRWLRRCNGLGETSRANLITVLNSARFLAVLHQNEGATIVIEYQQDLATCRLPRRVLLALDGQPGKVAVTADRGSWILSCKA